jgi:hypothetical protein
MYLCREEGLEVEEVEVVVVHQVRYQLVPQAIQIRHHRQRQVPLAVRAAVHKLRADERLRAQHDKCLRNEQKNCTMSTLI